VLKLSKKTDYAIILLTHLGEVNAPVSAYKVSEYYQLPYPMVTNILKLLVSSGLIKSTRGQRGGYVLARPAENIILSEIIEVTENPFTLVECAHDEELCKIQKCCPTKRTLVALHNKIQQFIEETTLATIVKDAHLIKPNFEESNYEIAHLS
jgi:Rrf2 family protein